MEDVKVISEGFSGFVDNSYISADFSNGALLTYTDTPDGCINTSAKDIFLCPNDDFYNYAVEAEKIAVGNKELYTLSNGVLSAYSREITWVKRFISAFYNFFTCMVEETGEVYFSDFTTDKWKYEEGRGFVPVGEIPAECDAALVRYEEGEIHTSEKNITVAEIVDIGKKTVIYKYLANGKVYYHIVKQK
jgi:hypothetical protein